MCRAITLLLRTIQDVFVILELFSVSVLNSQLLSTDCRNNRSASEKKRSETRETFHIEKFTHRRHAQASSSLRLQDPRQILQVPGLRPGTVRRTDPQCR